MTRMLGVAGGLALLAFCGMAAAANAADTVSVIGSKRDFNGDVTDVNRESVKVQVRSKTEEIPANEVESIKWSGEPAKLNVTRADHARGLYEKALKDYEDAKDEIKSPVPGLKADLDFGIAACTAELALQGDGDLDAAIAGLEEFRKEHPRSYHYYDAVELLARLNARKQDFDRARSLYGELGKSSIREYQMAQKIGEADILLNSPTGDPAAALAIFGEVAEMPASSPGEKARVQAARTGTVTGLIREKKFAEALAILDGIISDPAVTDKAILADAYLQQGKCHMEAGNAQLAVLSFLHIDTLLSDVPPAHAEALFHLSQLWPKVNKPARGARDRDRLESMYPNSPWAKQ